MQDTDGWTDKCSPQIHVHIEKHVCLDPRNKFTKWDQRGLFRVYYQTKDHNCFYSEILIFMYSVNTLRLNLLIKTTLQNTPNIKTKRHKYSYF